MQPRELWWLLEAKREQHRPRGMSEDEADDLYQLMIEQGIV